MTSTAICFWAGSQWHVWVPSYIIGLKHNHRAVSYPHNSHATYAQWAHLDLGVGARLSETIKAFSPAGACKAYLALFNLSRRGQHSAQVWFEFSISHNHDMWCFSNRSCLGPIFTALRKTRTQRILRNGLFHLTAYSKLWKEIRAGTWSLEPKQRSWRSSLLAYCL